MPDEPMKTTSDETSQPSRWEMLLPIYFLALLICGLGLLASGHANPPDVALAVYGVVLVVSVAGLFLRRRLLVVAIDRRNYMPRALSRWFWPGPG
jgi:hypothetical protein